MYGRTVGIFKQAIFRLSLVNSDSRTAVAEVVRAERTGQRHFKHVRQVQFGELSLVISNL